MRPRSTVRIVAEPIPFEMEPSEQLVNRSRWVDYRTEAPTSIALAEPPAGVKLAAPVSDQFIDPFPEFAARPRLAMSEQESQDSITANAVSAIRKMNEPSNAFTSSTLSSKVSVIGNTWPVALQMQSELNDFREIQIAECTLPIRDALRDWNHRIGEVFESLQTVAITETQSLVMLEELSALSDQGFSWASEYASDSPTLAGALNRVSYSVKRRVVVWTAVHACKRIGRERFVAIRSYDMDYNKLQERLETVRRALISTDDVENWGRYLMLDRIDDLAHQRIESRENQVGLAREFLGRVTDTRVTADQRRILTSAEVHRLADQVHPLTIGPVDYRKILFDIEAIESFVRQVLSHTAAPADADDSGGGGGSGSSGGGGGASAAERALRLVERHPEMLETARRLLQKPVLPPPPGVRLDDLPREVATRRAQLQRLDELEEALEAKDTSLRALAEEAASLDAERAEQAEYATRAHAFAHALQSRAQEELAHWATLADESAARLEEVGVALSASRHEALVLRRQNEELRDQNELLRHHCEELRELVTRAGLASVRPAQPAPGSAQWLVSS